MFIPILPGDRVYGFLMDKPMVPGIPVGHIQQPETELLMGMDQMQPRDDFAKFLTRNTLWLTGKPYSAHSLDVDHTTLEDHIRTNFLDCPEQSPVAITGDGFDLDTECQQIFEVFLQLFIALSATETVELGKLDGIVPVQNQTQVVGEISAVNDQIYPLRGINTQSGRIFQVAFEQPLNGTFTVPRLVGHLLQSLLTHDPLFKPYKLVGPGY